MATISETNEIVQEEDDSIKLNEVKRNLEGWREVLLPLNGLLNWEKPYHPAIIIGFNTFLFLLIWYFEPSVLTTFALLGLAASLIDFLVPLIGPNIVSSKWTGTQEQQFEHICRRIYNFRIHIYNAVVTMVNLKNEKPKIYFLVVMGTLVALAWVGSIMNNLLLTYFILTLSMLIPGIRKHAVLQKYLRRVLDVIKSLVGAGSKKKFKSS